MKKVLLIFAAMALSASGGKCWPVQHPWEGRGFRPDAGLYRPNDNDRRS